MKVQTIYVPYASGHFMAGWGLGPVAIRSAGLAARLTADGHDVHENVILLADAPPREIGTGFAVVAEIATAVRAAMRAGRFPLVIAGNCLSAVGVCAGIGADSAVWFDSHGDLNTPETSRSGLLDGMALATVTGQCWREMVGQVPGFAAIDSARVVLSDARDLDPPEAAAIAAQGIVRASVPDAATAAKAIPQPGSTYLHLDLDVHDPAFVRANRYAAPGGSSPQALRTAVHDIAAAMPLAGAAITAYDPAVDDERRVAQAAVDLAATLIAAIAEHRNWQALSSAVKL